MQRGGIPVNMGEHKGGQARERWPPFSRTRIKEYQGSAIFSRWNRTDCYLLRRRGVVWSQVSALSSLAILYVVSLSTALAPFLLRALRCG